MNMSMGAKRKRRSIGYDWPWEALLDAQAGIVRHDQARDHGYSEQKITSRVESHRWQLIHRGIYATFSGKLPRRAKLWAAVLWAGRGAMLSHETAAEVQDLGGPQQWIIHITVPSGRRPSGKPMQGVTVFRSNQSRCDGVAPWQLPRTQVEDTVLDLAAASSTADDAYTWVSRAVANRKVRVEALREALDRRKRFPDREWLSETLADAADGAHYLLELRYARDVERAHGLPEGKRQVRRVIDGKSHRKDTLYEEYRICVELDGITYHRDRQHQDRHRDNVNLAVDDIRTFRFDIIDVTHGTCTSAALVATALRNQGWPDYPHKCRKSDCSATPA